MKHNFLSHLELPKQMEHELPSISFERELAEHAKLRGQELQRSILPDYRYYAKALDDVCVAIWREHDRMFNLEMTSPNDQNFSHELYARWSFGAVDDYPARSLSAVARHMAWRLVPLAKWAGIQLGDMSFGFYIEQQCRQWADEADFVFHILEGKPLTRTNALSQIALIKPVRERAAGYIHATLAEIRKYGLLD